MSKISAKECQNVEYKRSRKDEYLKWICGFTATIKREMFMAIQAKGGDIDNSKDVVDAIIDNVIEKLSERQLVIYKLIKKSVIDHVVVTANSLASKNATGTGHRHLIEKL